MTDHPASHTSIPVLSAQVKALPQRRRAQSDRTPRTEDTDRRENRALRRANGITAATERVFRAAGVPAAELHATLMRLVRLVQAGQDHTGELARLLRVEKVGVNGTRFGRRR
jgi:hypothetical protein